MNWNKKQQKQGEKIVVVRDVKKILRKLKVRNTNNQSRRKRTRTPSKHGRKETCGVTMQNDEEDELNIPYRSKNQHTSSAVRFARLKSNRRYKPGD